MSKKVFFIIFSIVVMMTCFVIFNDNVSEKVYDKDYFSGNTGYKNSNSYDIVVNDDAITYTDENGNLIIYLFEFDKLANVYNIYVAENEVEARKIAAYFTVQIGNGQIAEVNQNENTVTVLMDMDFFAEYKDYTKKQIEDILLEGAEIIKEE